MEQVLNLLKLDLGIKSTARDDYYTAVLQSNANELESRGVKLDLAKEEDILLLSDYSAWLIRHRETGEDIPKNIKLRIDNRKIRARANSDD